MVLRVLKPRKITTTLATVFRLNILKKRFLTYLIEDFVFYVSEYESKSVYFSVRNQYIGGRVRNVSNFLGKIVRISLVFGTRVFPRFSPRNLKTKEFRRNFKQLYFPAAP